MGEGGGGGRGRKRKKKRKGGWVLEVLGLVGRRRTKKRKRRGLGGRGQHARGQSCGKEGEIVCWKRKREGNKRKRKREKKKDEKSKQNKKQNKKPKSKPQFCSESKKSFKMSSINIIRGLEKKLVYNGHKFLDLLCMLWLVGSVWRVVFWGLGRVRRRRKRRRRRRIHYERK